MLSNARQRFVRRGRGRQRGFAIPLVLICLAVAMILAAAVTKTVLMHYRHARTLAQRQQACWLAESALQRAVHQLRASSDYREEQWQVAAENLGGTFDASVAIQVEPAAESEGGWKVIVKASYPQLPPHRVVIERELSIDANSLRPNPESEEGG